MDQLSSSLSGMSQLSNSNPSLNTMGRPVSLPADGSLIKMLKPASTTQDGYSKEDVIQLAHDIQNDIINMVEQYNKQRSNIKMLLDSESKSNSLQHPQVGLIASLRQSLNSTLQQNSVLRNKLFRIHAESDFGELPLLNAPPESTLTRGLNGSLSFSSSCISEFFDAREYADSGEDTDDDLSDSDISDTAESGTEEDDTIFMEANTNSTINNITDDIAEKHGS